MTSSSPKRSHVAVLASPGMGHLVPLLELANRLVSHHNLTATLFVSVLDNSPLDHYSDLVPPKHRHLLDVVLLPAIANTSTTSILSQVCATVRSTLPHLLSSLSSSSKHHLLTALIVDLFGMEAFKTADVFGLKKYVFCTSNAWFLAETLYLPTLDSEIKPDEEMRIPGCKPIRYDDLLDPVWAWGKPDYYDYSRMGSEMATSDGILVNTWHHLEPSTLGALMSNELLRLAFNKTPIHAVGPLTRPPKSVVHDKWSGLLEWLDAQPAGSVLYVSFGSGGTLSAKQTAELAWGLELSQQRFVWVIRLPLDGEAAGTLFRSMDGYDEIGRFVPDGFLARTREVGRVVPMWGPQAEILAHPAVGGFLTHCGWNSTLEALTNGVPLIAWPLYAEQNMNATLLTEEAKVGLRLEALPTKEVVGREEIQRMVRRLMMDQQDDLQTGTGNGTSLRERAKALQRTALMALREGGSSSHSLAVVANQCQHSNCK